MFDEKFSSNFIHDQKTEFLTIDSHSIEKYLRIRGPTGVTGNIGPVVGTRTNRAPIDYFLNIPEFISHLKFHHNFDHPLNIRSTTIKEILLSKKYDGKIICDPKTEIIFYD
uniref:Uncharacterized protein n=1 Tax=viral metagenome TaxID=1070528 RepID=A0A6C0CAF3_9ZZZZ